MVSCRRQAASDSGGTAASSLNTAPAELTANTCTWRGHEHLLLMYWETPVLLRPATPSDCLVRLTTPEHSSHDVRWWQCKGQVQA